jgi:hypothetical protein
LIPNPLNHCSDAAGERTERLGSPKLPTLQRFVATVLAVVIAVGTFWFRGAPVAA